MSKVRDYILGNGRLACAWAKAMQRDFDSSKTVRELMEEAEFYIADILAHVFFTPIPEWRKVENGEALKVRCGNYGRALAAAGYGRTDEERTTLCEAAISVGFTESEATWIIGAMGDRQTCQVSAS